MSTAPQPSQSQSLNITDLLSPSQLKATTDADVYLKTHSIQQLFQKLLSQLILNKPNDPKQFLIQILKSMKSPDDPSESSYNPLFKDTDFETLFQLHDPLHTGTLKQHQVKTALDKLGVSKQAVDTAVIDQEYKTDQFKTLAKDLMKMQ